PPRSQALWGYARAVRGEAEQRVEEFALLLEEAALLLAETTWAVGASRLLQEECHQERGGGGTLPGARQLTESAKPARHETQNLPHAMDEGSVLCILLQLFRSCPLSTERRDSAGDFKAWCELAEPLKRKGTFPDTQTESRLVQVITLLFSMT